jgi:hypothetical protein
MLLKKQAGSFQIVLQRPEVIDFVANRACVGCFSGAQNVIFRSL